MNIHSKQVHNFSWMGKMVAKLGKVGRSLMFPIAVLPIAAILLRVGAQIPQTSAFSNAIHVILFNTGNIVFKYLYVLFAIGLAFGFTKDQRGEAAFAGFIGIIILTSILSGKGGLISSIYGGLHLGDNAQVTKNMTFVLSPDGSQITYPTVSPVDTSATSVNLPITPVEGGATNTFTIDTRGVKLNVDTTKEYGFMGVFKSSFDASLSENVLNGIIVGSLVAYIYNRVYDAKLPKILGFFAGRRLAPAYAILAVIIFGIGWAIIFPWIAYVIFLISNAMQSASKNNIFARAGIMGSYGFLNRLLIPFGLHHIPNNLFWFQLGTWTNEAGQPIQGDITIFNSGIAKNNPGGIFQAGFFPIMMFGLPALALSFYFTADNKQQKLRVLSVYGAAAIISFISGITEPIEFGFMFVSPLLYFIHAILTGVIGFITGLMGVQIGFGFSAGFMDYLLSIPKSLAIIRESGYEGAKAVFANPFWIIPLGAVTAALYFTISFFMIKKLNLNTPGRGDNLIILPEDNVDKASQAESTGEHSTVSLKARKIYEAYGGKENITSYVNCSTRLRYEVKDGSKVSAEKLKAAGAMGVIKVSDTSIQTIIGVDAETINQEIVTLSEEEEK